MFQAYVYFSFCKCSIGYLTTAAFTVASTVAATAAASTVAAAATTDVAAAADIAATAYAFSVTIPRVAVVLVLSQFG